MIPETAGPGRGDPLAAPLAVRELQHAARRRPLGGEAPRRLRFGDRHRPPTRRARSRRAERLIFSRMSSCSRWIATAVRLSALSGLMT